MGVVNASSGVKAGTVAHFAASSAPEGWIKANGAAISRTAYAALFAAIGTTYGVGDGSTTFNVPDLRGEFVRSLDDGRGVDSGRGIGTAQSATKIGTLIQHGYIAFVADGEYHATYGAGYFASEVGGTTGTWWNTRPRNVSMLACIKY